MKTTEEQIKDINKGNLKNSPFFICPYRDTLNIWIKDSRQTLNGRIIMSENTFTQEQVDEMIKERIARERKKFESEKKELERKHRETIEEYE